MSVPDSFFDKVHFIFKNHKLTPPMVNNKVINNATKYIIKILLIYPRIEELERILTIINRLIM